MAKDKIIFQLKWNENKAARLKYLVNNDKVVTPETWETFVSEKSQITVGYRTPPTGVGHVIEWGLFFADKKLTGLEAWGSLNGGKNKKLKSAKEKEEKWTDRGTLR